MSEDLRIATAGSADIAEGKKIADESCARCHGAKGVTAVKDVPHLAGQRPAYLYWKMRAYQSGTRKSALMQPAVKYLNDTALLKVAAYYASLDPASPRPTSRGETKAKADPLASGKSAATPCAGCHGETGVTATAGAPSLTGLDPKYLGKALAEYKSGQRKSDVMQSFASGLSDGDIKNIALFYALQKPVRAPASVKADAAAGKSAAAACAGCHGDQGVSTNPDVPSLAGQDGQYLVEALQAYKSGVRRDDTMKGAAADLSDQAMKNVAAFYAGLEPRPPKVEKPLTLEEWVQRCERCHGVSGNSTDMRTPALASQRQDYIERALAAYRSGERKDSVMAAMSAVLTDADIKALAAFYSHQRARAFVFVPITIPAPSR